MLLFRAVRRLHPSLHRHCLLLRTFVDARIKWVRDRGLDHAVEKEKNLRSVLALKDLIKSEPSNHLPISVVAEHKSQLSLPTRAFDFIRNYPSIFQEFLPPETSAARPHVRLTPEILRLDEAQQSIYELESYRQDAADRLLRLLMLTRIKKLPLKVIDGLRWDLGLPQNYVTTLVADYPDYFEVTPMKIGDSSSSEEVLSLELVCWIDELAVSAMEKKTAKSNFIRYRKGMPIAFPLQFSRGFDIEKKVKRWVDEWQKLPYISPYEDASHLDWRSDQAEKWTVGVLHELLHLLISKKTEKETILRVGECLGLRSRFRRALVNHPGIFYVSNKIRTHTAVLREGYKRDLLLEKHPLMSMRYQYIHLMNKGKELVGSSGGAMGSDSMRKQTAQSVVEQDEEDEEEGGKFGSEAEDASDDDDYDYDNEDDDDDDEEEEEEEDEDELNGGQSVVVGGESRPNSRIGMKRSSRYPSRANSNGRYPSNKVPMVSRRRESHKGHGYNMRSSKRSSYRNSGGTLLMEKKTPP